MRNLVHVILWSGTAERATESLSSHLGDVDFKIVPVRELRERGWRYRLSVLRKLRGKALVFFFADACKSPRRGLLMLAGLFHRCTETVIADSKGHFESATRPTLLLRMPVTFLLLSSDLFAVLCCESFVLLWSLLPKRRRNACCG